MKISIKAHPKASKERVVQKDGTHFEVWVNEPPDKGKANQAIVALMSTYMNIPKSRLRIVTGLASKNKIMEIFPGSGAVC